MSDENGSSPRGEFDNDTLPMGHEAARRPLLEMVVDADWMPVETDASGDDALDEGYGCEIEGARLRFERRGRKWRGRIVPEADGAHQEETIAAEDIGRVAREFKQLLKIWQKG